MKINKIIMCLDNNKNYTCYWNIVSDVWINLYKIDPVLIFVGSEEDLESNNFKHKEKIIKIDKLNLPLCHITWSLFWATQFFENETCMITGIDQIPLSKFFINEIEKIPEEKYVVGISDCYENYTKDVLGYFNTKTNVLYPSSHQVAKGKIFKKIFDLSASWEEESNKFINSAERYYISAENLWGLDECYSSEKISIYDQSKIEYLKIGKSWFLKNRIYLGSTNYSMQEVKKGSYSEVTYKPCYHYANEAINIIESINLL
jgi:hypothetical protein